MTSFFELDDEAYELICSYLTINELFRLSLVSHSTQSIVSLHPFAILTHSPIKADQLPFPITMVKMFHDQTQPIFRTSEYKRFFQTRTKIIPSCLPWLSSLNTKGLRSLNLDRTHVNALAVRELLGSQSCPQLQHLSIRFCQGVHAGQLLDRLNGLISKGDPIALRRLDAIGISGLPFFEPDHNAVTTFDAVAIELIGTGPEYDHADRWHDAIDHFGHILSLVPTLHGATISTDVVGCKQVFCNNEPFRSFPGTQRELVDSTEGDQCPPCLFCGQVRSWPACRYCLDQRSCRTCKAFVCADCAPLVTMTSGHANFALRTKTFQAYLGIAKLDCHATWQQFRRGGLAAEVDPYDAMVLVTTHHRILCQSRPALHLRRCFVLDSKELR